MKYADINKMFMEAANKLHPVNSCLGCTKGHCCRGQKDIHVTGDWIKMMKYRITPQQKARYTMRRRDGLVDCPFQNEDGHCEIYDDRPFVCASYHVLDPQDKCDTAKVKDEIQMVNPTAIAAQALKDNGEPFREFMEKDMDTGSFSVLDVFHA